jgi:NAD(P)-dependent dehydrogenase (short-subunit alcohol dehydrogenase family)
MNLEGRCVIITGAGSGIGRSTARRLAVEGMQVCVVDVNAETAAAVADEVSGLPLAVDVSDRQALDDAFARCLAVFGRLDVAYLNAGVSLWPGDVADIDVDNYRRSIAVNVDHVVFGTGAAMRAIRRTPADGGPRAIVATSSLAGIDPFLPNPIYTLTKHAVVGFVRALAPELAAEGIAAHAICPGLTDTAQLPRERKQTLEAAGAVVGDAACVADAVVAAITAPLEASGSCWIVHPNEAPLSWKFAEVPGPHQLFNVPSQRRPAEHLTR